MLTQSLPGSQQEPLEQVVTEEWRPAAWPIFVTPLKKNDNPREYRFERVLIGKPCGCSERCDALSCRNALCNRCCVEENCSFGGKCGNALSQNPNLVLSARRSSYEFGVTSAELIQAGEVIGEYRGYLTELGDLESRAAVENGYRMLLDTPSVDGKSIGIDALWCGTLMRFVNHPCNPNCRFQKGRKSGYKNYSKQEVLLLSLIVQQMKPLGKYQWERVKVAFDKAHPRTWPERDANSLKRKFKEAAATPKPTGKASVPVHIAVAKLAQKELDEDTSVRTMDDGLDDGTDDPELLKNVAAAARAQMDKITREFSADARARREAGMDGSGSEEQEEEEDSPPERTEVAEAAGAGAEQNESSVPDAPTGIILLRDNSTIDVRFAREFGLQKSLQEGM
ncbi:SET domain-containing protein 4 [Phytophthora cinnamomi]|uniref:SET domain-containing protein 4 n=1 Tax=Phytophthora cinnamomi TaxID=4785 RepID=UPI003559A208|nr:SET domain-containing protein 4 [Phytophthora cinnamomi]